MRFEISFTVNGKRQILVDDFSKTDKNCPNQFIWMKLAWRVLFFCSLTKSKMNWERKHLVSWWYKVAFAVCRKRVS